ncbi:Mov34/MPN/PAD-1 family protein [Tuwongella immobilis]|uniref:MPN domain-containing protein n=1 Tax=Tuwongella immobilis TaxID=692036 RepID=A0A6C2YVU3_9BACT|nr:M67 family metallopeptidase [Tuwongella immobilis]VIP05564.1 mov34 mpn pad-1 family protein : Putative metal-dependent protease of the PAD1/JAB1 superfamily OS=Singulisphaera acidiphila (strain ATCC BAA-1392 / DSM 18658 / VKM B-2454 / MOB10) GN=Sinac_2590 PE=4 SV=1: Prok-JAB [Tuwongella immobilis]VTS08484.1 mov34 mpn pad-1 family protein : Putative metal-dependent protease of the PAD1/JAB1 superfamily OS=Singulisphaera acidiphila (strain ATCC BAA-1392 / DSM 18658 / VKM B-2454 / MOB10) GN=Sinac
MSREHHSPESFSERLAPASTPFRLQLPQSLFDELIAHAQREAPLECCGILAGEIIPPAPDSADRSDIAPDIRPPIGMVRSRYSLINEAASPIEFRSEAKSMFAATRLMNARNERILAIYHSHPTSLPIPSRKDRADRLSDEILTIIIGLTTHPPEIRAWWLTADTATPAILDILPDIAPQSTPQSLPAQ